MAQLSSLDSLVGTTTGAPSSQELLSVAAVEFPPPFFFLFFFPFLVDLTGSGGGAGAGTGFGAGVGTSSFCGRSWSSDMMGLVVASGLGSGLFTALSSWFVFLAAGTGGAGSGVLFTGSKTGLLVADFSSLAL